MLHVQSGTIGKLCTLKSLRMENDGDSTSVLVFLLATTKGGEHNKFSLTLKTLSGSDLHLTFYFKTDGGMPSTVCLEEERVTIFNY